MSRAWRSRSESPVETRVEGGNASRSAAARLSRSMRLNPRGGARSAVQPPKRSSRPSITQESSPASSRPRFTRSFSSRASEALQSFRLSLVLDHGDAVGAEQEDVAGADRRATDDHRQAELAEGVLAPAGTRIHRAQIGRPIRRSSSASRTAASRARRPRRRPSPASPAGRRGARPAAAPAWSGRARRRAAPPPSPRAREVVVLRAPNRPRRSGRGRAGDELMEVGVDDPVSRRPRTRSPNPAGRAR